MPYLQKMVDSQPVFLKSPQGWASLMEDFSTCMAFFITATIDIRRVVLPTVRYTELGQVLEVLIQVSHDPMFLFKVISLVGLNVLCCCVFSSLQGCIFLVAEKRYVKGC